MSTEDPTGRDDGGHPNPWLIMGGSILIGLALTLLLFGNNLWDRQGQADSVKLPQIPADTEVQPERSGFVNGRLIEIGDSAPDFELEDLDGNPYELSELNGRPVIVNFWATWCGPCRVEMPELQAAFERYQNDGLVILAVNYDEPAERVGSFFYDEMGLTFVPLLDEGGLVAEMYGVFNFPSTFFIGRDSVVKAIHRGPLVQSQIEENLAKLNSNLE